MFITKIFHFSSAHFLTDYHGKCENLHGHNYKLEITVKGDMQKNGMVIDFAILKKIVKENIIEKLDHKNLNDLFKNPSAENICIWIWEELENKFDKNINLHEIKLWETENNCVIYKK
ncbi:6-carboxytetrahydropterin synthase QueD [Candidatus Peregrinibacteria bacterium RIFOXYB2_FULL_32_7]|nr:MAG: 6-carboxytetrahydropterin synthase QueD [Candidatus Peregrinibacteria bacterium RIFOXYB2_FULL_32_7]